MGMTDAGTVRQLLESLKVCPPADIHRYFAPATRWFRLLPKAERHDCAQAFHSWAREHGDREPLKACYAEFLLALEHFMDEDLEPALQIVTTARHRFEELNHAEGVGLCSMLTGGIYRTFGNYDLALKVCWEAFGLLKESGHYPVFVAANANSIANISLDMHDFDAALKMFRIAYDESAAADDFYFNIYALHGLAKVYLHQHKPAEAARVCNEALQLAQKNNSPLQIANSLTELANLKVRSGHLADAESLHKQALAIREEHGSMGGAITSCMQLAAIYATESRPDEAFEVLEKALGVAERSKVKPKLSQVHRALAELYESGRDLEKSLFHYKRFHELREQVDQEDSTRKIRDARLVFEAEQTKKENIIIRQQKAEIHAKNLKLQETIDELTLARINKKARALTIGLGIVLFIFQDRILGFALDLLSSTNYFLSLGVKMGIIFSLSPINGAIERYLLRKVIKKRKHDTDMFAIAAARRRPQED